MRSKETIITGAMLILITYTLALSLVGQGLTAGQSTQTLSSTGSIMIQATYGIGVYSDAQCMTPQTTMNWGTLSPGATNTITCYIKNEGSVATTLSKEVSNWNPTNAQSYLTFGWDYAGQVINPGASMAVTFSLEVSPSITGITTFSFQITVIGNN